MPHNRHGTPAGRLSLILSKLKGAALAVLLLDNWGHISFELRLDIAMLGIRLTKHRFALFLISKMLDNRENCY